MEWHSRGVTKVTSSPPGPDFRMSGPIRLDYKSSFLSRDSHFTSGVRSNSHNPDLRYFVQRDALSASMLPNTGPNGPCFVCFR